MSKVIFRISNAVDLLSRIFIKFLLAFHNFRHRVDEIKIEYVQKEMLSKRTK